MKNKTLIYSVIFAGLLSLYNCKSESDGNEELTNNGLNELYLYNVENNTNTQLTYSPDVTESRHTFSSDSRKVIFFTPAGGYTSDLYSPNVIHWTGIFPGSVDYSADRNQIVYSLNKNLFIMNTDGTGNRQLTFDNLFYSQPKWSKDGQKIVCNYTNGGCLVTPDGTISNILGRKSWEGFDWSLDSNTIFYPVNDPQSHPQIFSYNLSGNLEAQLTTSINDSGLAVNPVNGKIVFVSSSSSESALVVMNADGSEQTAVYHGTSFSTPCWSPDGTRIAFIKGQIGLHSELALIDANGENFKIISSFTGGYMEPVWSPNGKLILYRRVLLGL